uniref:ENTH domain-containing protein n=1 Tax=Kalanchoe fedtschenkoi TaxID=63787 RepID=A0A7N0T8H7_KALFE
MGILERTCGAIKDSTSVGIAKINSSYKNLDIAIIKSTSHLETPPKERYVRKIFSSTSASRPRADVAYCIHALAKRLAKTRSWIVALKVLVVIHRTLREGDPSFREELLKYSLKLHFLHISNFKDNSSPLAWDYSAWVRAYALFLEERLHCYRTLRYDVDSEPLTKGPAPGAPKTSRTRYLGPEALLVQLPALQQLLFRLVGCKPEGVARESYLIQYALLLVLKESFKIFCAINDGFINLVDKYFDMPRHDAAKALSMYRRGSQQADELENFYDFCKGLELARLYQFPMLKQPPTSFLSTMEEHLRDLRDSPLKSLRLNQGTELTKEIAIDLSVATQEEPKPATGDITPPLISLEDNDYSESKEKDPKEAEIDEISKLELAIVPSGDYLYSTESKSSETAEHISTGWELALVTSSINDSSPSMDYKMGGGFDKLLLDSLYEDENARRRIQLHQAGYNLNSMQNPFDHQSLTTSGTEMGLMHPQPQQFDQLMLHQYQLQQQQLVQQNSMMYTGSYPQHYPQQMQQHMTSSNPFADPLPSYPQSRPSFY